jgi:hypothetical protein
MKALTGAVGSLRQLWRGELPLSEAFWTWAVVGGIAVNLTTTVLFVILLSADQPLAALLAGHAISIPYNIVAVVGVWQSAARYKGNQGLASLARMVAVVGMTLLSIT